MATYFVKGTGGSDAADGLTWANAKATFQAALTAASSGTDVVVLKYDDAHTLAADTTFTTANHVTILSASADDTGTAFTPTAMGETGYIGHSSTSYQITVDTGSDDKVFCWGLTFRVAGSTAGKNLRVVSGVSGCDVRLENCKLWMSGTGSGSSISILNTTAGAATYIGCEFKFGATSQTLTISGPVEVIDSSFTGSAPTTLTAAHGGAGPIVFRGCDLSNISGTLIANSSTWAQVIFDRCKFYSTFPTAPVVLAAQTSNPTRASASVLVLDCHGGDTHGFFGYYDAFGSVVSDTTVKVTAGAAAQSWKITTTANCSFTHPFCTPWIDLYNSGTSAITPKLEVVRTGSATAYKDSEVWSEWLVKTEAGYTQAKTYTDRQTFTSWVAGTAGANQATGDLGSSDWEGEGGTAWFGKLSPGSLTPDEVGSLSARVCVGLASISGTLYVDPQIRT